MITCIFIVTLAFYWLLIETDYLRVNLSLIYDDASLIASAPDMYEALKVISKTLKAMPDSRSAFELGKLVDKALAKAEGKE